MEGLLQNFPEFGKTFVFSSSPSFAIQKKAKEALWDFYSFSRIPNKKEQGVSQPCPCTDIYFNKLEFIVCCFL